MTHFMAYVILLSAAAGAAAIVAELILRARTGSTRWPWLGALGAVLVIAGIATFAPPAVRETPVREVRPVNVDGITASPITVVVDAEARADAVLRFTDAMLPSAWAIASAILLMVILYGQRRLARERRASNRITIQGREVLLTESVGPAVAGVSRPFVLLPRWALALDAASQELLLAHEFEHVKRGDTRVLLAGAVAVALMPWNPVVWWISRRLRLAVERDCDARVLAAHPNVRRYADLLLTAASRHGVSTRLLAAHFGEYHSDLEARIQTMTDRKLKWGPTVSAALVAVVLIAVSCEAPRPEPLAPGAAQKGKPAVVSATEVLFEYQVEKPVTAATGFATPRYPEILRQAGVEGEVLVSFVVDEGGTADPSTFKVIRSTHELFATAVRQALSQMRFVAAEVGGKKVKQLVQQPFSFTLPGTKAAASRGEATAGYLEEIKLPDKKPAFMLRRGEALAEEPNVVVYAFDGRELARSEGEANLLQKIEPQSIHKIEVYKPRSCPATMTCPLIKITLAKGQTLGQTSWVLPRRQTNADAWEPKAEPQYEERVKRPQAVSSKMNIEVLSRSGEVLARYGSREALSGKIDSEDIAASEAYSGTSCKAGTTCPLTRIWIKAGREGAYRKR
jgi:TonB family protein